MTTLLIDNYDSFTYNLVQMLSSLGESVHVLKNDDVLGWESVDWDGVNRIVVSPGPGNPENRVDLGLSRSAIVGRVRPLLGVCLGHQALCHLSGGSVGRAPQPMHGRTSRILHDGDELFAGVPPRFEATRYHSLVVDRLPDELKPIARSEDGLLMAVRHREWPAWGVQFHPESIGSQYGEQMVKNFLAATGGTSDRSALRAGEPVGPPRRESTTGRDDGPVVGVEWTELGAVPDPGAALLALFSENDVAFWIDTLSTDVPQRSLSYLGAGVGPACETLSHRVDDGFVRVHGANGESAGIHGSIFEVLSTRVTPPCSPSGAPVPLNLGYVGWFGYELRDLGGPDHGRRSPHPDAFLVLADRMLVIDSAASRAWLAALRFGDEDTTGAEWIAWAKKTLADLSPLPVVKVRSDVDEPVVQLRHDVPTYLGLIERCQELIRAGESYQLCLTNELTIEVSVDPLELFRVLRHINPAPFSAYFRTQGVAVVGSSPERFLLAESGRLLSKPMKGTRSRGADPVEDARLRDDLATSMKDRAENLMITDLVRNDLGSVASPGTVRVDPLLEIETFPHVHQMVSTVHGTLEPGRTVGELLRATFPGGSMTGAPKRRSTELLDILEGDYRGIYSGALGFVSLDGRIDLSMVIRTAVVTDAAVRVGVGGAITALSDPPEEVAEMMLKGRAVLLAVAVAADGRSTSA